jgi:ABC-type transport system involved in multi-copper enzyme maturation permease subunit
MAIFLYIKPELVGWYIAYVVVFNMLVGPVFSAGSVTSERERETLDLLLTTTITPWQILWGKLIAGLRISVVLTMFLVWPLLLACLMVNSYWPNLLAVGAYLLIILLTCLTTAMLALFCSVSFRKTSVSLMSTYFTIIVLFCIPVAVNFFTDTFYQDKLMEEALKANVGAADIASHLPWTPQRIVKSFGFTSPFTTAFSVPLDMTTVDDRSETRASPNTWHLFAAFCGFTIALNGALLLVMIWLFNTRWRVSQA